MSLNELDEAELRAEMRALYREVGFTEAIQVLLEILTGASILAEVIAEERNEKNKGK